MAQTFPDGDQIPLHIHKRGQLIHAVSGTMKVETADAAWIVPPALALWMPPAYPHGMAMRGELAMRTIYIDPASCRALPGEPMLVEIGGLLRELILAALEEPLDYDEAGRGGLIAQLILAELARMQARPMQLPMPRDPRAIRVARALLSQPDADGGLDDWARTRGREPPHAGAAVSRADRLQLQRMARAPARDRRPRTAVERRSGRQRRAIGRLCEPECLHRDGAAEFRRRAETDDDRHSGHAEGRGPESETQAAYGPRLARTP